MAVPGSKPKFDIHAKVRIGEKRTSQGSGREYPAAFDFFMSDNDDFAELAGAKPKTISIRFVHPDVADAFSTGLEWWVKSREAKKPTLACYTKDDGPRPVALRKTQMLDSDDEKLGAERGSERTPILCRARECPHMQKHGNKPPDCKPMGRLVFVIDGDPLARVWQIDTKSWNSIEALTGALGLAQTLGPLTGRLFSLSVQFVQKGADRFPVLSIKEITDECPQTGKAVAGAEATIASEQTEGDNRAKLIAAIEARGNDPRDPKVVAWVTEKGVDEALRLLTAGS